MMQVPTFLKMGDGDGPVIVTMRFPNVAEARAWCEAVLAEPKVQPEPQLPAPLARRDGAIAPAARDLPAAVRARRGLPEQKAPALQPPLTGGPESNVRADRPFSDDEDLDILDAGAKGEQALDAVAFAQCRSVRAVRRRHEVLLDEVSRALNDG